MITAVVFIFGLIVGSFLNVCIARIPLGRSIATPPSHCPQCSKGIRFYDNIPLLSYLLLRGRCRHCGLPISFRYPLVELMNGLLYVWIEHEFWLGGETLLIMLLCSALIVITFIDYDHQIIPDVISLPGMLIGIVIAPFFLMALAEPLPFPIDRMMPLAGPYLTALTNSLLGVLCGGVPLFAIGWIWEKLRHVEAMGGGDIKLMGMVGSFLGWKGALLTIMIGSLAGSLVGVLLILLKKHEMGKVMPFGPYLAFGAVLSAFYASDIISWYLGFIRL